LHWNAVKPDVAVVLEALKWQTQGVEWTKCNGDGTPGGYVPHAWRYLEGHRWGDSPPPISTGRPIPAATLRAHGIEPGSLTERNAQAGALFLQNMRAEIEAKKMIDSNAKIRIGG
jgi:hypothetical protein